MPEEPRAAVGTKRIAAENGGSLALGVLAGAWYGRFVEGTGFYADPVEIAAIAAFIPVFVSQVLHLARDKGWL